MPLTHVRCRWLDPRQEQKVEVTYCRACCAGGENPCGLPVPVIAQVTADRDPDVVQCSATMFGGCPREHGLKKREDYSVAPDEAYTRAFGSLVHLGAETLHRQQGSPVVLEKRYKRELLLSDGRVMTVTAQVDVLHQLDPATVIIKDYKAVPSVSDSDIARRLPHHIPQFSIQRWILAAHALTVARVDLIFLSHKAPRVVNLYPDGEPEFPDAYLMSLEKTERYLLAKGPILLDNLEGRLSAPLTSDTWKCKRCDVRAECVRAYGRPIPGLPGWQPPATE